MEGGKLTPDEMKFYRGVFVTLDWMNNKQIPCNPQLKLLLTASRLPVATLGQLWTLSFALAKNQNRDWLSDRDLCIVLRLVAMAQTGQVPSYEGSRMDGLPLPKIDIAMLREAHKKAVEEGKVPAPGGAAAPAAAAAPPPAVPPRQPGPPPPSPAAAAAPPSATPASPPPSAAPAAAGSPPPPQPGQIDWSMSDKQKQDYQRSFDQLDQEKKGIIPALNAVGFLRKSKLPEEVLREIWKLSDLNRDGALDLHEFCIAMHLVLKARSNIPLPPTLPPVLLPGRSQAQIEAEEKAKKEAEARLKEQQAAREQAAKEQAEREQAAKEQAAKEQAAKEQAENEAKERQLKEQQEREQKEKQEQERAKEQQAKQQAEEVKSQSSESTAPNTSEQKAEEKSTPAPDGDQKAEGEPAPSGASKFRRAAPGEGSGVLAAAAAASPAPAPRSRPREPPRSADSGDAKRTRSPAARNRSPATRTNVKPGEPTIGWDNTVKLDREDPLVPLASPAKPGDAVKAQPAIRAWIEALLVEKIAPGLPLFDALKSGVRLCKMLNVIDPNSILDISTQMFMRESNINAFLDALRRKGFKPSQLFLVEDLMEQKDMEAVYSTIIELDKYAETVGFEGPRLKR